MSRISAAWPVAGNGLRGDSGESAEFPTSVKGVVAMFALRYNLTGDTLYKYRLFCTLTQVATY
jgi:hypothetical protein